MSSKPEFTGLEIAVIGIACHFPGAPDYRSFWKNLVNGSESVDFLTDQEIKELGIAPDLLNNQNYVRSKGAPVTDKDKFDHSFFGYSEKEASVMDPQMRIMHECVWAALEDAGCDPFSYAGKIGLVAGIAPNYSWLRTSEQNSYAKDLGYFHTSTLMERDFSPLTIAYRLNLRGPAYSMFTTCSTSLVAIHQACRALLTGEAHLMLAGGVALSPDTMRGYVFQEGMILSRDGHCRAFDKESSGTIKGEGSGFVVLKRLKNALEDKDNIYAVIKGSAVNNDGNAKTGFFAPGVNGQREVIESALRIAKTDPASISYIEAHGTGTHIGDPIEIASLTAAFNTDKKAYCAVGSVKTNIGHLDTAAGVAGFIKTVLCIRNRRLVPSLHFNEPNPHIRFPETPFYVINESKPWTGEVRMAGVSSFGIGGTNAHVVLGNFEQVQMPETDRPELFLLSARNPESLDRVKKSLQEFIKEERPGYNNMAYTLMTGRKYFSSREFAVTDGVDEFSQLENLFEEKKDPVSSWLLSLPDLRIADDRLLAKFMEYNHALNLLYKEIAGNLNFGRDKTEQIPGFVYQLAICRFLERSKALPQGIFAAGTGKLAMLVLNDLLSVEEAVKIMLDDSLLPAPSGKLKYPFSETPFAQTEAVLHIGDPAASYHCINLNEGAKTAFRRLLEYFGFLWKSGAEPDFRYFQSASTARKISMPTYPFEPVVIKVPVNSPKERQKQGSQNWFYKTSWQKTTIPAPPVRRGDDCTAFIFKTGTGLETAMSDILQADQEYELAQTDISALGARIAETKSDSFRLYFAIDLKYADNRVSWGSISEDLDITFFRILDILRLFAKHSNKGTEVNFILNHAFDITGIDPVNASLSVITAITKIIPLEMNNIRCRIIDINDRLFNEESKSILHSLLQQPVQDLLLAIREGSVWVKKLQRFLPQLSESRPVYVKENGLYIVTGGFGGMGYVIARHLLENTSARVILLGRTGIEDIRLKKASEFNAISSFGDRAQYLSIDISDAASTAELAARSGTVNGIFHTAGLADFGGIAERRTNESIREVMMPKIYGAVNLYNCFNCDGLDFLVLFSSVGNILFKDKVGQIGYNAANEFLDAFSNVSPKVISINWCDWKERGMTVDAILKKYGKKTGAEVIGGLNILSNAEGVEVLNMILNEGERNIIVYKEDLFAALNNTRQTNIQTGPAVLPALHSVKEGLKHYFREHFSLEVEDEEADFFELGADSLTIINSLPKINLLFGVQLSVNDFYDHPSVGQLAAAILNMKKNGFTKNVGQVAVKLGKGSRLVFAFPPAIGFGFLAYSEMAALMPDCTIYAFNFLPENNRIEKYLQFINDTTGNNNCVLMGYSAGGTLAYEVAKALDNGKVTDLVIFDTYIYRLRYTRDRSARKMLEDFFVQGRENFGVDTFRMIAPLMARYYFYVNNTISTGSIAANIHLIKASDREQEETINRSFARQRFPDQEFRTWKELTTGGYSEYTGYGSHHNMLTGANYKRNIGLMHQIVQQSNTVQPGHALVG